MTAAAFPTIEARVAILPILLDAALGHVLDSSDCPASIGVSCGTCRTVLRVPTSGPLPVPDGSCVECPDLLAAAARWRRARLGGAT